MADWRTNSQPARCASIKSPAKTPVIWRCFVEADVEEKGRPHAQGHVAQFLPQRIALRDAEGGVGIGDVLAAVIAHDAAQPAATRDDPFDAAAEAGEEMRLDEAGDDAHVRLRPGGG